MIKLSEVRYPGHRPATAAAVAAWMLDSLVEGKNEFPWVFDDVKKNAPIDIFSFRATIKGQAKARGIDVATQSVKNQKIILIKR